MAMASATVRVDELRRRHNMHNLKGEGAAATNPMTGQRGRLARHLARGQQAGRLPKDRLAQRAAQVEADAQLAGIGLGCC